MLHRQRKAGALPLSSEPRPARSCARCPVLPGEHWVEEEPGERHVVLGVVETTTAGVTVSIRTEKGERTIGLAAFLDTHSRIEAATPIFRHAHAA